MSKGSDAVMVWLAFGLKVGLVVVFIGSSRVWRWLCWPGLCCCYEVLNVLPILLSDFTHIL